MKALRELWDYLVQDGGFRGGLFLLVIIALYPLTRPSGSDLFQVFQILMLVALNVLAAALVNWVAASGLDAGWAALIVGGGIIVLALIFLLVGRSRIKPKGLMPERTARNVRSDVDVVRGKTHA